MGWGGGGHAGRATQLEGGGGRSGTAGGERAGGAWAFRSSLLLGCGEVALGPWCGVWSELWTKHQVTLKISMMNETTWSRYEVSSCRFKNRDEGTVGIL